MSADEKRIREFAYQIWESEGQPEGQEERHWKMARKLAEAEAAAPEKSTAGKAVKPKASKANGITDSATAPAAKSSAKAVPKPAAKAAAKPASKPAAGARPAAAPTAKVKQSAPVTQAEQPAKSSVKKPRKPSAP